MTPEFLNADEVAARLRIAAGTMKAWVRSGRLPGIMLGPRCLRIRPADLEAWLARQQQIELQPESIDDRQAELDLHAPDPVLDQFIEPSTTT